MSKFVDVMEETQSIFDNVLMNTTIPHWVQFKLISNNNQKELYVVKKMSELFEVLTDNLNVVIVLNEEIFDKLEDEQKKLVFEEILTGIIVNDNDKINLEKPNFTTYSSMLQKHGDETMIRLKETILSLYEEKREKEIELKENKNEK